MSRLDRLGYERAVAELNVLDQRYRLNDPISRVSTLDVGMRTDAPWRATVWAVSVPPAAAEAIARDALAVSVRTGAILAVTPRFLDGLTRVELTACRDLDDDEKAALWEQESRHAG